MKKALVILKKAIRVALSFMKLVVLTFLVPFVFFFPWIMVSMIVAALPKKCTCPSVQLPACPVVRPDEPCHLLNVGLILMFIFYFGVFFIGYCFKEEETDKAIAPDNKKKEPKKEIRRESKTIVIV